MARAMNEAQGTGADTVPLEISVFQSPIGLITLQLNGAGVLVGLSVGAAQPGGEPRPAPTEGAAPSPAMVQVHGQLEAYFSGELREFSCAIDPGGTPFQRQVWGELCRIPFGVTCSYSEVARRIAKPGATRAVGAANGRNPIAIIIPCHRVVGADGSLTGYAAGIETKAALLAFEQGVVQPSLPF